MKPIISLLLVALVIACNPSDVKLDTKLRRQADSIFASRVDSIGPRIDSLCAEIKDSLVQMKYDSIIEVRKKRIRELSQ